MHLLSRTHGGQEHMADLTATSMQNSVAMTFEMFLRLMEEQIQLHIRSRNYVALLSLSHLKTSHSGKIPELSFLRI